MHSKFSTQKNPRIYHYTINIYQRNIFTVQFWNEAHSCVSQNCFEYQKHKKNHSNGLNSDVSCLQSFSKLSASHHKNLCDMLICWYVEIYPFHYLKSTSGFDLMSNVDLSLNIICKNWFMRLLTYLKKGKHSGNS